MIQIEFDYNQIKTVIQAHLTDTFQDVINKYTQKALLDPKTLCFLANGKVLDPKKTVESQTSKLNKENNIIKVIVNQIDKEKDESVYVKSKDIICPTCNESCRIKIENYKIKLYDCINNHINIINIKDFQEKQKINISNIICEECNIKNKGNEADDEYNDYIIIFKKNGIPYEKKICLNAIKKVIFKNCSFSSNSIFYLKQFVIMLSRYQNYLKFIDKR